MVKKRIPKRNENGKYNFHDKDNEDAYAVFFWLKYLGRQYIRSYNSLINSELVNQEEEVTVLAFKLVGDVLLRLSEEFFDGSLIGPKYAFNNLKEVLNAEELLPRGLDFEVCEDFWGNSETNR